MMLRILLILPALLWGGEWKPLDVIATAYCPCSICCGVRAVGLTADGTDVCSTPYGIAADPKVLPYGTLVWIPKGNGYLDRQTPADDDRQWWVDDTGGIIRRRTRSTGITHIDLRFIRHKSAQEFGIRHITIYIWAE